MIDFYAEAADAFAGCLHSIEKQGRRESPEWQLAKGLLRLAQGLRHDHDADEERRKSFAKSGPRNTASVEQDELGQRIGDWSATGVGHH